MYAVKYCKNAISCIYFKRGSYKKCSIDVGYWEVGYSAAKCSKKRYFVLSTLQRFEYGSYQKCSIDEKFYMDKQKLVAYVHTKFQAMGKIVTMLQNVLKNAPCTLYFFEYGSYKNAALF